MEETLDYVRRQLTHPGGAFCAAQDTDSEGEEGNYFVWTEPEILSVLGSGLGGGSAAPMA